MNFKKDTLAREQSSLVITKAKSLPHGQFEAVLSTDDLDRHGEHVSIAGLTIPKNQVIKMYYNHETNGANLPIGKWLKVWKKDGKLMGLGEIDLEDEFAVKVYKKVLKGIIDSISIGFYPTEYDGETATWTASTLVEASVVAEPANVNAVITQKELGFTQEEFKQSLKVKLKETKTDLEPDTAVPAEEEEAPQFEEVSEEVAPGRTEAATEEPTEELVVEAADDTAELKSAIEELKSKVGALEDAAEAANDSQSVKQLIKVRLAGKAVDQSAEALNQLIKVKLKDSQ